MAQGDIKVQQENSGATFDEAVLLDSGQSVNNLPTADQKAALAGTSGTPSASNKYATAEGLATKMANPMTAANDIIIGGTSGSPARLAKGTDEKILKIKAGNLVYDVPVTILADGSAVFDLMSNSQVVIGAFYTYWLDDPTEIWPIVYVGRKNNVLERFAMFSDIPSKAAGSDINTGTDDAKFVTSKAIADSNVFRAEKAAQINGLTNKDTPVDADTAMIDDSAASNAKKKVTWANIKATLKAYFDTLYNDGKTVIGINEQTGETYTLALADAGKLVRGNRATAITITVPKNTTVDFPLNTVITIEQMAAGQITVAGATDVTVNAFNGRKTGGQYAAVQIVKVGTNTWTLYGGVA
jgi:hypothetical protein